MFPKESSFWDQPIQTTIINGSGTIPSMNLNPQNITMSGCFWTKEMEEDCRGWGR